MGIDFDTGNIEKCLSYFILDEIKQKKQKVITNTFVGCVQSFGERCRYPCSKHCLNKTCNEVTGNCLYGCEMRFYGDKCDKGWFLLMQNIKTSFKFIYYISII